MLLICFVRFHCEDENPPMEKNLLSIGFTYPSPQHELEYTKIHNGTAHWHIQPWSGIGENVVPSSSLVPQTKPRIGPSSPLWLGLVVFDGAKVLTLLLQDCLQPEFQKASVASCV